MERKDFVSYGFCHYPFVDVWWQTTNYLIKMNDMADLSITMSLIMNSFPTGAGRISILIVWINNTDRFYSRCQHLHWTALLGRTILLRWLTIETIFASRHYIFLNLPETHDASAEGSWKFEATLMLCDCFHIYAINVTLLMRFPRSSFKSTKSQRKRARNFLFSEEGVEKENRRIMRSVCTSRSFYPQSSP